MEISKSALRFSFLFFLSFHLRAESFSDKFLFRISQKVFSANDFNIWEQDLVALKCYMPDSLFADFLGPSFYLKLKDLNKNLSNKEVQIVETHPMVPFLSYNRQLFKLQTYVQDQKVVLAPGLAKDLVSLSKAKNCQQKIHNGNQLRLSFEDLLRLEIYLRSKYHTKTGTMDNDTKVKRFQALALFVESIDRQLHHENFW